LKDKLQDDLTEICSRQRLARIPEQCLGPPPLRLRFEVWLYQSEAVFWQVQAGAEIPDTHIQKTALRIGKLA